MYLKFIEGKDDLGDFKITDKDYELAPNVNTKIDSIIVSIKTEKTDFFIHLMFRFDYMPPQSLEVYSLIRRSMLLFEDKGKIFDTNPISISSIESFAAIYWKKGNEFMEIVHAKFIERFGYPLIGDYDITEEQSIKQSEILLNNYLLSKDSI